MTNAAQATLLLQLRTLANNSTVRSIGLPGVGYNRYVINVWIGTVTHSLLCDEPNPSGPSPTFSFDTRSTWNLDKIHKVRKFVPNLANPPKPTTTLG